MPFLYDILLFIGVLVSLPYLFLRKDWHRGFGQRLGAFSDPLRQQLGGKRHIWIHAVSVGEILAVAGLMESIRKQWPDHQIVFSTVTTTGQSLAKEKWGEKACVLYAPLDIRGVVKKFVHLIKPQIYLCVETEIWPNLFQALHHAQVPIVLVNGRISDRSYRGYQYWSLFLRNALQNVSYFCMQTPLDKERIITLGADEDRVAVVGNVKFDMSPESKPISREALGFDKAHEIFIAGSTHPGEEEIILDMYQKLRTEFSALRVIMAPRHIERVAEVVALIKNKGLNPCKFSALKAKALTPQDVVVVDTIGQLRSLYAIGTLVFIGKTLKIGGGQNMIEPAFYGKPIIVGPRTENFKDVVRQFLAQKAMVQVSDTEQLYEQVKYLLGHPQEREKIGRSAEHLVRHSEGATVKTLTFIKRFLERASSERIPA